MSDWNDETPDDFTGGDLQYLESYKEMEVDNTFINIGIDATNLVTELCNMYLKNDLISNEDHVKAIASIEITQLTSAMMAVRSVEHALQTLMRQLDAGGYVNENIFEQINTLSKTSMDLTIKATHYVRSLPEYLKFTATEMKEQGLMKAVEIVQDASDISSLSASDEDSGTYGNNTSGPIVGTRALMLQIRDEENNLPELIANAEEEQKELERENLKMDDESDFGHIETDE
ncbi:hypothetical protein HYO65_gp294 [Tenacibaculum phage PTm1]|uniref:Uncharacterized protein n=2 Tax=Shirahamavirus PTm1 TaxID=2846435 RepID=A0A5S9HXY7_9CAUD|nr:hypothetical protein HYO65_gp294 [Tenacibaculum phage PTm1]BBI90686.1 hypothetical protein [Tenacibaculum phage PTm1]BBI90993.1 hypothetical protein [Tenacibaculum phage PTm5]